MRCLIIARELAKADPSADIRFLVNRHAVFRESVNFPIIDCEASPTLSTPQVLATIESFRPDVMVFDNSGRTSQLRAAKRAGARLVFSSRAPKLRWKAFRIKWMRLLDEHWIVFPTFVTGGLSRVERLKLRFFPHYGVRQFDTLFTPSDPAARNAWLARSRARSRSIRRVRAWRAWRSHARGGTGGTVHRGRTRVFCGHRPAHRRADRAQERHAVRRPEPGPVAAGRARSGAVPAVRSADRRQQRRLDHDPRARARAPDRGDSAGRRPGPPHPSRGQAADRGNGRADAASHRRSRCAAAARTRAPRCDVSAHGRTRDCQRGG